MSLLCADAPHLLDTLAAFGIEFLWHPALSEASGSEARSLLEAAAAGDVPVHALCLEGAMMRGPDGGGRFHLMSGSGEPMIEWVRRLASVAEHTVAVGSCAAFGGIPTAGGNPTNACGAQYEGEHPGGLLGESYRSRSGLPVINVAGCPPHPGWVTDTLAALATGQLTRPDLDALARPRMYADQLAHHGCPRNEYYEFKASAEKPSDLGCLMENMGCMGTQAHADCNTRLWNGTGSCTIGGGACINCTAPEFQEPGHPFAQTPKIAGFPIGLPLDMPKAWFVALSSLSKAATPPRVRENATSDHTRVPPAVRVPRK